MPLLLRYISTTQRGFSIWPKMESTVSCFFFTKNDISIIYTKFQYCKWGPFLVKICWTQRLDNTFIYQDRIDLSVIKWYALSEWKGLTHFFQEPNFQASRHNELDHQKSAYHQRWDQEAFCRKLLNIYSVNSYFYTLNSILRANLFCVIKKDFVSELFRITDSLGFSLKSNQYISCWRSCSVASGRIIIREFSVLSTSYISKGLSSDGR